MHVWVTNTNQTVLCHLKGFHPILYLICLIVKDLVLQWLNTILLILFLDSCNCCHRFVIILHLALGFYHFKLKWFKLERAEISSSILSILESNLEITIKSSTLIYFELLSWILDLKLLIKVQFSLPVDVQGCLEPLLHYVMELRASWSIGHGVRNHTSSIILRWIFKGVLLNINSVSIGFPQSSRVLWCSTSLCRLITALWGYHTKPLLWVNTIIISISKCSICTWLDIIRSPDIVFEVDRVLFLFNCLSLNFVRGWVIIILLSM